jgi:hypothetical protein
MLMHFDWQARTQDFDDMTSWEEKARKQAQQVALRTREAVDFARNSILKSQERQAE